VLEGAPGTPYVGGFYHGMILFPNEYPLKPPGIKMLTPSGRFAPNELICTSFSSFHEELWNPVWGVEHILLGLQSFMNGSENTVGAITTDDAEKRRFASRSLDHCCTHPAFRKLFPELVELKEKRDREAQAASVAASGAGAGAGASAGAGAGAGGGQADGAAAGPPAAAAAAAAVTAKGKAGSSLWNLALLLVLGVVLAVMGWMRKANREEDGGGGNKGKEF
jgi:ubiquitin-conjugating enzyme E2 J2